MKCGEKQLQYETKVTPFTRYSPKTDFLSRMHLLGIRQYCLLYFENELGSPQNELSKLHALIIERQVYFL